MIGFFYCGQLKRSMSFKEKYVETTHRKCALCLYFYLGFS